MQELAHYTLEHCTDAQMVTGALVGGLLKMVVRMLAARRVLEIGLFTGYSALAMAEELPDDGELISCEIDETRAAVARDFLKRSRHGGKVRIMLGPAKQSLRGLTGGFDMVFLDADKEGYIEYYECCLPLLRRRGLLVADNTLWSGRVLQPEQDADRAVDAFNRHVQDDQRVDNLLLTVRDGVMLAFKRG